MDNSNLPEPLAVFQTDAVLQQHSSSIIKRSENSDVALFILSNYKKKNINIMFCLIPSLHSNCLVSPSHTETKHAQNGFLECNSPKVHK